MVDTGEIEMIRCITCLYPTTKPDLFFNEAGECSACVNAKKKPTIDWDARKKELEQLLDRHNGRVIVPSSGGKDSHFQAITLKEMGCDVTAVTASTCHLTPVGRRNIDNLARHVRTIEVTPNMRVRAKLNKLGLRLVGDISLPEHMAIFTTPFKMAVALGIPLIMYGENSQFEYGGPPGSEGAREMTRRWVHEFGGHLGVRPSDLVGQDGITARDMQDYEFPKAEALDALNIEAHFLGQYVKWDSHRNAQVALKNGMRTVEVSPANWWPWENLDCALTMIHDAMMYRKFGYGRGCAQISVDVRAGMISREKALAWVLANDGKFPEKYAGVTLQEMLVRLDLPRSELNKIMDEFTNWELMRRVEDNADAVPILI